MLRHNTPAVIGSENHGRCFLHKDKKLKILYLIKMCIDKYKAIVYDITENQIKLLRVNARGAEAEKYVIMHGIARQRAL